MSKRVFICHKATQKCTCCNKSDCELWCAGKETAMLRSSVSRKQFPSYREADLLLGFWHRQIGFKKNQDCIMWACRGKEIFYTPSKWPKLKKIYHLPLMAIKSWHGIVAGFTRWHSHTLNKQLVWFASSFLTKLLSWRT